MKKNSKRTRLQSLDAAQLAQVSGGAHASTELLQAAIDLLGVATSTPSGSAINVVYATAVTAALK